MGAADLRVRGLHCWRSGRYLYQAEHPNHCFPGQVYPKQQQMATVQRGALTNLLFRACSCLSGNTSRLMARTLVQGHLNLTKACSLCQPYMFASSGGVCGLVGGHCLVSGYIPLPLSAAPIQGAAVLLRVIRGGPGHICWCFRL